MNYSEFLLRHIKWSLSSLCYYLRKNSQDSTGYQIVSLSGINILFDSLKLGIDLCCKKEFHTASVRENIGNSEAKYF